MNVQAFSKGSVIFRQGDAGDCMYEIQNGSIGIYHDYDGPNEKKIARLMPSDVFGEMGLLDHAPRSATAVVLEDDTVLALVSEEDFLAYFEQNPARVMHILQQLCFRLRNTTADYLDACRTVYETAQAEKAGKQKSATLLEKIKKLCDFYSGSHFADDV